MEPPLGDDKRRIAHLGSGRVGRRLHSIHGALTESEHVFIARGLERWWSENEETTECVRVLEVGFGTGLNAARLAMGGTSRGCA